MEELSTKEINSFTINDLIFSRVVMYVNCDTLCMIKNKIKCNQSSDEEERYFKVVKNSNDVPQEGIYINGTVILIRTRLGNIIVYKSGCIGEILDNSFFDQYPAVLFSKKKDISFSTKYDMLLLQQDFSEEIKAYKSLIIKNDMINPDLKRKSS